MAKIAMLGQGGYGGLRFANMVRYPDPARDCDPNVIVLRDGSAVRRHIPAKGHADINRRQVGNDARRAERIGLSVRTGSVEACAAEMRDMS